ncbi:hypothetical protein EHP00_535 [Ecytonucleospora hepatopenaei]|uniref:Uncharacterized protein n=1 Tax=Ecytonucleospora hepatopenaei TaxID=646526 RepID=A0A1W0E430_9MICR|nr:hypothetical protein EHP00_535 [Ecytonucleospora hepatopenaei]
MIKGEIFLLIGIYLKYDVINYYEILVLKDTTEIIFKVDHFMDDDILYGEFCEGDFIRIIKKDGGVVFEISQEKFKVNRNLCKQIKEKYDSTYQLIENRRMPFLNDTLPFTNKKTIKSEINGITSVELQPVNINGIFQGKFKVLGQNNQEVAAQNVIGNEIGPIKSALNKPFVAKIQQKTRINTIPNKFNPFFFIIASSSNILVKIVFWKEQIAKYSELNVGDIVLINSFKKYNSPFKVEKLIYNTFTESVYFSCQAIRANTLYKVESDFFHKNNKIIRLFKTIHGDVVYSSMIFRHNHANSFLQFKYIKLNCEGEVIYVVLFYNSQKEFYNLDKNSIILHEMRRIDRGGLVFYVSTIYTQIEITGRSTPKPTLYYDSFQNGGIGSFDDIKCVHGGIGYIPDSFKDVEELCPTVEIVKGKDISTDMFMPPYKTTLEEIMVINTAKSTFVFKLALNEVKKFYFMATITGIEKADVVFDYVERTENHKEILKQQEAHKIILDSKYFVHYTDNLFYDTQLFDKICESIGDKKVIFVDAIRISSKETFLVITGILSI